MVRALIGKTIRDGVFGVLANLKQDDSAIRRISIPELYLSADACLILLSEFGPIFDVQFSTNHYLDNVTSGFVVYPEVIKRRVNDELPFMAT